MSKTLGPVELRIRWVPDDEEPQHGFDDDDEMAKDFWSAVELYGVYGCVIETRAPACGCCGRTGWEHAESLWSIIGDADYHREIERDLMMEV